MERALAFLKRHAFLLAGLGLPLALIATLIVARTLPRFLVEDPRYALVYASEGDRYLDDDRRTQDVRVIDGRLTTSWTLHEQAGYQPRTRVFVADPLRGTLRELDVPEPEVDELQAEGGSLRLEIPGLDDARVDTQPQSPDGWEFDSYYRGGGGIFGDLFGSHGGLRTRIEKDGRALDVPRTDEYGYGALRFLGWVVPDEAPR